MLANPGYWTQEIQLALFNAVEQYLEDNQLSRSDFAKKIGVSKGYVSQILNGDFDHKLSKLVELALACDLVPAMTLIPLEKAENAAKFNYMANNYWKRASYTDYSHKKESITLSANVLEKDYNINCELA